MTTTTTQTAAEAQADILAVFNENKAKIEATNTFVGNYVLRWYYEGSSLFVGRFDDQSVGATGFDRALKFGDREAAVAFLKSTQIRNGHGHPTPCNAFMAKQTALVEIEKLIKQVEAYEVGA